MAVNGVIENDVVELWQKISACGCSMSTKDGQPLNIIYPGRPSDTSGGDLTDAVIGLSGKILSGRVEFHTFTRDWYAHGHHLDPAYNRVILHVVMWRTPDKLTKKENGGVVPVVAICDYCETGQADAELFSGNALPCTSKIIEIAIIEQCGIERFMEKASNYQETLKISDPGESLYRGFMEALGYSRNKEAFLNLARSLPLKTLEYAVAQLDGLCLIQSILLGAAGLLPSQRNLTAVSHDPYVEKLEQTWLESGLQTAVPFSSWQFFKVRPGNHPVRRIMAMACLIHQCRETGFLNTMKAISDLTATEIPGTLLIPVEGYWVNRFDFGKTCFGIGGELIGAARAHEIAINVLLPFAFAWRNDSKESTLKNYSAFPAAGENIVEKHMRKQLGLKLSDVNTACRRQGLLHIYKNWCLCGNCAECPLS